MSQMTRVSWREHDLAQAGGVWLRRWMSYYDFMATIGSLNFHDSRHFVHSHPLSP
jgi:hypothetical protein